MVFDSGILCTHTISPLGMETLADILRVVTGYKGGPDELFETGERINCLERAFNTREGITLKDDMLPDRILNEGTSDLPSYEKESLDKLLDEYYKISGWDDQGIPKEDYLQSIGLKIKDYR